MKKRVLSIILAVSLVFSLAAMTGITANAYVDDTLTSGNFEYEVLDDGTVEIIRYNGNAKNLNIPSEIDGKKVTEIGSSSFRYCDSLTSITIPDSVTTIVEGTLAWCDSLTSIFVSADNKNYSSENGVLFNKDKTTLIQYPPEKSGENYTIPNGVNSIVTSAFYDSEINFLTIPDSVTNIGDWAFERCAALKSIEVSTDNQYYASENGVLFNKDKTTLIQYPIGRYDESYTIPDNVKIVGDGAFSFCYWLKSVTMPDSLIRINYRSFQSCSRLNEVIFGNNVNYIGYDAFDYCESLESVTIPDSVTDIEERAFEECPSLKSIKLGKNLRRIGVFAFHGSALYNDISNWENGVLYIGDYLISGKQAYNNGHDVKTEVTGDYKIKDGTKAIADDAFNECGSLESITIPNSVTSIGYGAFRCCWELTGVIIPDNVTSIGDYTFMGCESLKSITIPDSVTSIGDCAFDGCEALTSITIPEGVTKIGEGAFAGCESLTSITIPDSVITIGDDAFAWCDSLTSVTIPDSVTSIGDEAFGYYYDEDYDEMRKINKFHINCYKGTAGEKYAIDNGFDYTLLDSINVNPGDYGDANGDGKITANDVLLIRKSIAGQGVSLNNSAADVNADGKITATDVLMIRKSIAGQNVHFGK